jgi:fructokinase
MPNHTNVYIFGEVLFDHFPDGSRILGGAPFNVAWHLQAFGQLPHFISRVGDDSSGNEIMTLMDAWGMRLDDLQVDSHHPTGSVQLLFKEGEPQYEIVPDCAYDFIDAKLFGDESTTGILYHGSLALRNPVSYASLQTIKTQHQGKIFVDVNLRTPWWNRERLLLDLNEADWVKLNAQELFTLAPGHFDLHAAMLSFSHQFHLETLVVTLGANGAVACDINHQFISISPPKKITMVDTVGAGDAFAAILLLGIMKYWPLAETLERAQKFASAVVGKHGAIVAQRTFYHEFITQWL